MLHFLGDTPHECQIPHQQWKKWKDRTPFLTALAVGTVLKDLLLPFAHLADDIESIFRMELNYVIYKGKYSLLEESAPPLLILLRNS